MQENKQPPKALHYKPRVTAGGQLADAMPEHAKARKIWHIAPWALAALAVCAALLWAAVAWPGQRSLLGALGLGALQLAVVLGALHLYLNATPEYTASGHMVLRPGPRLPLILTLLVPAIWGALRITGFDMGIIIRRFYQLLVILRQIFAPDWSYLPNVLPPLIDTIKMSVMGSVLGSTLALPFAIFASTNINRSAAAVGILRILLNFVRTLPTLVIASIAALIFRLGTFAGTVAITIFTFGIVSKMLYESIETIDMGAFEALESQGASRFRAFWTACMPQILPTYLSHSLYSFEINVRAASILGYVGAGGLGILINERIGWRDYYGLGTVLVTLFIAVLIIENLSEYLRRKLS